MEKAPGCLEVGVEVSFRKASFSIRFAPGEYDPYLPVFTQLGLSNPSPCED